MLSRSRDKDGYLLEIVRLYFDILPESNPIHVRDITKLLIKSVEHINGNSVHSTFNLEKNMNELAFRNVPENKLSEVVTILESTLIILKNQGAINSYCFK